MNAKATPTTSPPPSKKLFFKLNRELPARHLFDRLHRKITRRCRRPQRSSIWVFHRVHPSARDPEANPFRLMIHPEALRQLILEQRERAEFMFVDELIRRHGTDHPEHLIALSFDDGYLDNHRYLFPLIQELQVPVTIFLNSDWLNGQQWRLCDMLHECCNKGTLAKEELVTAAWRLHHLSPKEALACARTLWHRTLPDHPSESDERRGMSASEVQEMAKSPFVRFEAHGHQHLSFSQFSEKDIMEDVQTNCREIHRLTGRQPKGLAYPYGRPSDVHPRSAELLDALGISWAVLANNGENTSYTNPHYIDRHDPSALLS